MRTRLFWSALLLSTALAGCGGGGGDPPAEPTTPSVPTTPTPPPAPAPPQAPPAPTPSTISKPEIVFPEGAFYRSQPYVFKDNHLTLTAKYTPGGMPMWSTLAPEPSALQIFPGPFNATAFLRTDRFREYRVQLGVDYGTFQATPAIAQFRVIPPQIEYVVEVANLASGDTTITVRPGRTNAPMADCLVFTKDGCQSPSAVEASVGTQYLGRLQQANAGGSSYVFRTKTASLIAGEINWVRVRVDSQNVRTIGLWSREVLHGFSTSDAVSTKGVLTVDTSPGVWSLSATGARVVGNPMTVVASGGFGQVDAQEIFRLAVKPTGSAARLERGTCGLSVCVLGAFFADKPGLYIVEYGAGYPDGSRSSPVYSVIEVLPHVVSFRAMVFNENAAYPDYWQTPRIPPDSLRVEVLPNPESTSEVGSPETATAELFVDGLSRGKLSERNVHRYVSATSAYRAFGWDIPKQQLGSTPHAARVVYTDTRGNVHEGTFTLVVGTDTQAGFGPFLDPNP